MRRTPARACSNVAATVLFPEPLRPVNQSTHPSCLSVLSLLTLRTHRDTRALSRQPHGATACRVKPEVADVHSRKFQRWALHVYRRSRERERLCARDGSPRHRSLKPLDVGSVPDCVRAALSFWPPQQSAQPGAVTQISQRANLSQRQHACRICHVPQTI